MATEHPTVSPERDRPADQNIYTDMAESLKKLGIAVHDDPQRAPDAIPPTSRLLSLPPELRNHIYSYVLPSSSQEFRFMYGEHAAIPSLLHTNEKVRSEAIGLYYGNSTFEFIVHYGCVRLLLSWITAQSAQTRKALLSNRNVNVRVMIDRSHKHFDKMQPRLSRRGLIDPASNWHFSTEHYERERMPVAAMMNVERSRERYVKLVEERAQLVKEGEIGAHYPKTEGRHYCKVELQRVCHVVLTAVRAGQKPDSKVADVKKTLGEEGAVKDMVRLATHRVLQADAAL
ncbi:hypothetical protein LTR85_004031 [Meristemomyces frigidus]|nr:hypothetical protein LTR85_004031 [Meristemomyces frigidus]